MNSTPTYRLKGHHAMVDMQVHGEIASMAVTSYGPAFTTKEAFQAAAETYRRDHNIPSSVSILNIHTAIRPIKIGATVRHLHQCASGADCKGETKFKVKGDTRPGLNSFGDKIKVTIPPHITVVPATVRPDGICGACFHERKRQQNREACEVG